MVPNPNPNNNRNPNPNPDPNPDLQHGVVILLTAGPGVEVLGSW